MSSPTLNSKYVSRKVNGIGINSTTTTALSDHHKLCSTMTKINFPIFILCTLLIASTSIKALEQTETEPPLLSPTPVVDDEDNGGEICDPSKQNPCESPAAECIWNPLDMLYKCIHRGRENKRNFLRKRQTKRKKPVNPHVKSDEKDFVYPEKVTFTTQKSRFVRNFPSPVPVTQSSGEQNQQSRSKAARLRAEQERQLREKKAQEASAGTREVPEYSGVLTWDGKTESETCTTTSDMASALQEQKSMESKLEWIESHRDTICNFKKFFHCVIEQPDNDIEIEASDDYIDIEPQTPVCRCYETSMPVVNGMCYIPADFGAKSSCGEHITVPYPIQPWKGAPILKPKCTPNSDCKESQYWFGKRCTCRYNAKWNSVTHTCDNGSMKTMSIALLSTSFFILFLCHHLTI